MASRRFTTIWVLALVFVTNVLAAMQNCSESSFRNPGFAIDDLRYDLGRGSASFRIQSIATDWSASVSCPPPGDACHFIRNSGDEIGITFTNESASITVARSWTCSDKRWKNTTVRLTFNATGAGTFPTSCNEKGVCSPRNREVIIRASLLSPVIGTPRYLDPLPGQGLPNCRTPPEQGLWQVSKIKWWERDYPCVDFGGGPAPGCQGHDTGFEMDVFNSLLNYTVQCRGLSWSSSAAAPVPISCEPYNRAPKRNYNTYTTVLLQRSTPTLQITQTWQCEQQDQDVKPSEITAHGSATTPLTCTDASGTVEIFGLPHPWRNTSCTAGDTSLSASSISRTTLPRFALEEPYSDPYNHAGTCLLRHLRQTKWDIESVSLILNNTAFAQFTFSANDKQLSAGPNNSNGVSVPLVAGTNHTDGSKWVDCHYPEEKSTAPCRFQFDSESGRFTLMRFTRCDDVDGRHPYLITATASYTVPEMHCSSKGDDPGLEGNVITRCTWQAETWRPENLDSKREMMEIKSLSDITWEPMPQGHNTGIWDGWTVNSWMEEYYD